MKERLEKLDARLAKMNETNTELAAEIGGRADARKAMEDRQVAAVLSVADALAGLAAEQKAKEQALADATARQVAELQAQAAAMAAAHATAQQALADKAGRQQESGAAELKAFDVETVALTERRAALKGDYGVLYEARGILAKAIETLPTTDETAN